MIPSHSRDFGMKGGVCIRGRGWAVNGRRMLARHPRVWVRVRRYRHQSKRRHGPVSRAMPSGIRGSFHRWSPMARAHKTLGWHMDSSVGDGLGCGGTPLSVLFIEPDASVRQSVEAALVSAGFRVVACTGVCASAREALGRGVDLILVDALGQGWAVSREWIRSLDTMMRRKVVLTSVRSDGLREARELCLGGFLEKPMSFPEATQWLAGMARGEAMAWHAGEAGEAG